MNARETLSAARQCRVRLEALLERRDWYAQVRLCRSGGTSEPLERVQREVDQCIDAVAEQELAAMRQIDALDDPGQREVLRYRYLSGWEWKEIARRMNYSMDWVKHLHTRAMKAMESQKGGGN